MDSFTVFKSTKLGFREVSAINNRRAELLAQRVSRGVATIIHLGFSDHSPDDSIDTLLHQIRSAAYLGKKQAWLISTLTRCVLNSAALKQGLLRSTPKCRNWKSSCLKSNPSCFRRQ